MAKVIVELDKRTISINNKVMGGIPCLAGHRITIAQIIGELGSGRSAEEFEDDFSLERGEVKRMLMELAASFDKVLPISEDSNGTQGEANRA